MLDARLRTGVGKALAPVGKGLRRVGITANILTVVGPGLFRRSPRWLIAIGELRWAVLGLVASGLIDLLDGSVARTSGEASPRGAFFDSVTDRVSDAVVFGGCAWYLASEGAHLPVLAFAAAALAMLISYERARAEALGYSAKGGLMERAERMVVLGVGLMFNILVPVLWLMVVLMTFTAIQRFVVVWRQASDTPGTPGPPAPARPAPPGRRRRRARPRRGRRGSRASRPGGMPAVRPVTVGAATVEAARVAAPRTLDPPGAAPGPDSGATPGVPRVPRRGRARPGAPGLRRRTDARVPWAEPPRSRCRAVGADREEPRAGHRRSPAGRGAPPGRGRGLRLVRPVLAGAVPAADRRPRPGIGARPGSRPRASTTSPTASKRATASCSRSRIWAGSTSPRDGSPDASGVRPRSSWKRSSHPSCSIGSSVSAEAPGWR